MAVAVAVGDLRLAMVVPAAVLAARWPGCVSSWVSSAVGCAAVWLAVRLWLWLRWRRGCGCVLCLPRCLARHGLAGWSLGWLGIGCV